MIHKVAYSKVLLNSLENIFAFCCRKVRHNKSNETKNKSKNCWACLDFFFHFQSCTLSPKFCFFFVFFFIYSLSEEKEKKITSSYTRHNSVRRKIGKVGKPTLRFPPNLFFQKFCVVLLFWISSMSILRTKTANSSNLSESICVQNCLNFQKIYLFSFFSFFFPAFLYILQKKSCGKLSSLSNMAKHKIFNRF